MTAPVLRPATMADLPALSRLGIDSFVDKFGDLYRPQDLAAFLDATHSPAAVARELADPTRLYCLAEADGRLAGYCKLGLCCGWPEFARGHHAIELKQLYTAPGMTGMGLGHLLMDWALSEARSRCADEMQLSVYSANDGAQRFYARYGFAKVADIQFWVGEQCDEEFLFVLRL
jgi:ribosomal protein S18 acetylase RimI-like enzyme